MQFIECPVTAERVLPYSSVGAAPDTKRLKSLVGVPLNGATSGVRYLMRTVDEDNWPGQFARSQLLNKTSVE